MYMLSFLYTGNLPAQSSFFIDSRVHYGFVLPHHKEIEYLTTDHVPGLEINIGQRDTRDKSWSKYYRYPFTGVGYFHANLKNPVLGKVHAFYPFISFPLGKGIENPIFSFYLAFGLSYLTEKYDLVENPTNIAIGSHMNIFLNLALDMQYPIGKNFWLNGKIGMMHMSNGRVISPNLGINLIGTTAGIKYYFNPPTVPAGKTSPREGFNPGMEYSFFINGGTKTRFHFDTERYYVSSIMLNVEKRFSRTGRTGMGIDIFYDGSIKTDLKRVGEEKVFFSDLVRIGARGGYDIIMGKTTISLHLGYYLYTEYVDLTRLYTRFGLRYALFKNLEANIAVKSHYAKADFVEWGIGYRFFGKNWKNE
jgi:hypothetical protein